MLQAMRNGAGATVLKLFLMSFLVLAVAGLVLSDVGGFFRGGVPANFVVKGGGISISAMEFDQTVRRTIAQQGISPQDAYQQGMVHMILHSEIQQRLMTKRAHDLGLRTSDELVSAQIAKIAQGIAPASGGSRADTLKQILRSQGISEAQFIQSVRQETANSVLQTALAAGGSVVPAALADDLARAEGQTRDIKGFTLKNSAIKDFDAPNEEKLQSYYEANKVQFAIPETRTITLATLNSAMIESRIEITDDELQDVYQDRLPAFTKPERRRVQQAIFTDAKAAKKAVDAVKSGKSLKQASGNNFMGEEAFEQSGLIDEIASPVFSAREGNVIGPVQTALGHHVMVLAKILPPDTEPFEKVKKIIRDEIMHTRVMDEMMAAGNDIDDRLAAGDDLDTIVKEMGLTTQKIGPFRQNGMDAAGKDRFAEYAADKNRIIEAAFDLQVGEAAPVIETADGRFLIVHADDATVLSYKPYDDVKNELRQQWIAAQQKLLNQSRARDAHKKLQEGAKIEDVAKELGTPVQTFNGVKRDAAAPKGLGPVAVARLFQVGKDDYILAEQEDGVTVAAVTAIKFPEKPADGDAITAALKQGMAGETLTLFVGGLPGTQKIKINEERLRQMYGPSQERGF